AEDGIRDRTVTGVQTCALPILIRVVLVKEDDGAWRAYFCTHASATVTEILEAVADRAAEEQVFHDVKEVHGVGQAQTRNYWSNEIGRASCRERVECARVSVVVE